MEYYVTLYRCGTYGIFKIDAYTAIYIGYHKSYDQAMSVAKYFFGDNVETLFPSHKKELMIQLRRIENIITLNNEHIVNDITINNLISESYKNACDKGFHDNKREHGTGLMLLVSEAGEALESVRKSLFADRNMLGRVLLIDDDEKFFTEFQRYIKDTYEDEIADIFIRLCDLCGNRKIDVVKHIVAKMRFNKMRKSKHGKSF